MTSWYGTIRNLVLLVMLGFSLQCSLDIAGGGTEDVNTMTVIGMLYTSDNQPASHTQVQLIPEAYNPVVDEPLPAGFTDTTDTYGVYHFDVLTPGRYNIQAVHISRRTRALITAVSVRSDIANAPDAILKQPGSVTVTLTDTVNTAAGYLYVPGTTIARFISSNTASVTLDSVPSGLLPVIYYTEINNPIIDAIRYDIPVPAGDTVTITHATWNYSKHLYLNTTSPGADVSGTVTRFPVLIRLTNSNFTFTQAADNGSDIRFTKPDNTPLPHEIERWDVSSGNAAIWVLVDTVYGNNNTQYITMYWGNPDAADSSSSSAVFDTVYGFQGVWHLGETAGNTAAWDATGNEYHGAPYGMTEASAVPGVIGGAREFDGTSSYFMMPNTANSKLNFPENGAYTVSAWVYTETLDSSYRMIVSKGDYQYNLEIMYTNDWEFAEFKDQIGWDVTNSTATKQVWTHVAGVRSGDKQYLYVNGTCTDSTISVIIDTNGRQTGLNLMFGKKADAPLYFFDGKMDEVRINDISLSADWIKLSYMNQKVDDLLVEFR